MKSLILTTVLLASPLMQFAVQSNEVLNTQPFRKLENTAFTYGEKLNFRVHYGVINAANIEIKVEDQPVMIDGRPTFHIKGTGKSISAFDWFFKVRDHFQSWVDVDALAPLRYHKDQREGGYKSSEYVFFNHQTKRLSNNKGVKDMPQGIQDVISATYYARNLDFSNAQVGQIYPIEVYLDNEIYKLQFKFAGRENLKTELGTIRTLKIIPMVVADRVFKDEEGMTIWVSDDKNKVPLLIQAEILVGSIKASITQVNGLKHPLAKI